MLNSTSDEGLPIPNAVRGPSGGRPPTSAEALGLRRDDGRSPLPADEGSEERRCGIRQPPRGSREVANERFVRGFVSVDEIGHAFESDQWKLLGRADRRKRGELHVFGERSQAGKLRDVSFDMEPAKPVAAATAVTKTWSLAVL